MKKLIAVLALFILFGLSYYIGKPYFKLYFSKDEVQLQFKGKSKSLKIKSDLPMSKLGEYLFNNDLIENERIINDLVSFKNYSNDTLKAGKYLIKKKWSNNILVNQFFLMRNQNITDLYIPSVRSLNILAGAVANQTSIDSLQLCKLFNDQELQQSLGFNNHTFPTFFLPNTFEVYSNITIEDFIDLLRVNYKRFWSMGRIKKANNIGLSQSEVTILASIIQMEQQVIINEHPKIAGLYINRLKKGMKLQADPTVKFAINEPNLKRVLNRHLKYDSPYNTYLYKGLPPGPICIPEVTAIDAVLNYEKHDYLYMCAEPTYSGRHSFAVNYKGHIENYKLYKTWLDKEGIK